METLTEERTGEKIGLDAVDRMHLAEVLHHSFPILYVYIYPPDRDGSSLPRLPYFARQAPGRLQTFILLFFILFFLPLPFSLLLLFIFPIYRQPVCVCVGNHLVLHHHHLVFNRIGIKSVDR